MFENIKSNLKWFGIIAAACALSFAAGRVTKPAEQVIQVEEKVVEKVIEKVVEVEKKKQERIVSVTEKPDGTKTTTTIDSNSSTSTASHETSAELEKATKAVSVAPAADPYRPTYSAGAEVVTDFRSLTPSYRIQGGYRVLGNAWVSSSYDLKHNELGLGVRVDF